MTETDHFSWSHLLYRLFNAAGDLLYVGRTNDLRERFHKHAQTQPWWNEVTRSAIETFPDFTALCAAEKTAIIGEKPKYNKVYSTVWVVPQGDLPDWLFVSPRVTAGAEWLHETDCKPGYCDLPGYNPQEPPCTGCGREAARVIEAADQAAGHLDPTVREAMDAMRVHDRAEFDRTDHNGAVVFGGA